MNKEQMQAMFGCDINEFKESIDDSITVKLAGIGMVIMGLMSDAQEEMSRGMNEQARQTLNRAKFLISEYNVGMVAR